MFQLLTQHATRRIHGGTANFFALIKLLNQGPSMRTIVGAGMLVVPL